MSLDYKFWMEQLETVAKETVTSTTITPKTKANTLETLISTATWLEGFSNPEPPKGKGKPKREVKEISLVSEEKPLKPYAKMNLEFWEGFINYTSENTEFTEVFEKREPAPYQYLHFYFNNPNCYMNINQNRMTNQVEVEFIVKDDRNNIFENLKSNLPVLESEMNSFIKINQNVPRRGNCSFTVSKSVNFDDIDEVYKTLVELMLKLYHVIMERIELMS